jgi:hypothetical protein
MKYRKCRKNTNMVKAVTSARAPTVQASPTAFPQGEAKKDEDTYRRRGEKCQKNEDARHLVVVSKGW